MGQCGGIEDDAAAIHARRLAALGLLAAQRGTTPAPEQPGGLHPALDHIIQYLAVAEFLAREGRSTGARA